MRREWLSYFVLIRHLGMGTLFRIISRWLYRQRLGWGSISIHACMHASSNLACECTTKKGHSPQPTSERKSHGEKKFDDKPWSPPHSGSDNDWATYYVGVKLTGPWPGPLPCTGSVVHTFYSDLRREGQFAFTFSTVAARTCTGTHDLDSKMLIVCHGCL
jgi:hypothetical protein